MPQFKSLTERADSSSVFLQPYSSSHHNRSRAPCLKRFYSVFFISRILLIMVGSIANMKKHYNQKSFTYVPPTPPAELIDCDNFILDFADRKFLNVGFDSEDKFNIVIHIITPSRYVSIYEGFLRRTTFSLMGNILSFILDISQKSRKQIFLEDEFTVVSNMVYRGENVLVVESKKKEGCRVLLDRKNLMKL
ncbi:uncharacterized protein LOC113551321 [Rhopalosiphum maidis]|uniref:uncharacterized protein LOC113551321 n=1 Tax=Rhopalosiphum maidis TaxID=43146 RepID=UPI000EFE2BC0|nr:uncharacterized protein LOC113551321 [Rhopalosiphum maidis]